MPRNEGNTLHQLSLAGKRGRIRDFPSKMCDEIGLTNQDNRYFEMVPGNFEKVPNNKAVPRSELHTRILNLLLVSCYRRTVQLLFIQRICKYL